MEIVEVPSAPATHSRDPQSASTNSYMNFHYCIFIRHGKQRTRYKNDHQKKRPKRNILHVLFYAIDHFNCFSVCSVCKNRNCHPGLEDNGHEILAANSANPRRSERKFSLFPRERKLRRIKW